MEPVNDSFLELLGLDAWKSENIFPKFWSNGKKSPTKQINVN